MTWPVTLYFFTFSPTLDTLVLKVQNLLSDNYITYSLTFTYITWDTTGVEKRTPITRMELCRSTSGPSVVGGVTRPLSPYRQIRRLRPTSGVLLPLIFSLYTYTSPRFQRHHQKTFSNRFLHDVSYGFLSWETSNGVSLTNTVTFNLTRNTSRPSVP